MALTPNIAFGIMNIMRICIQHIDDIIAGTLSTTDAVRFTADDIRRTPKGRQLTSERMAKKIRARLESEWGIKISLAEVMKETEHLVPTGF